MCFGILGRSIIKSYDHQKKKYIYLIKNFPIHVLYIYLSFLNNIKRIPNHLIDNMNEIITLVGLSLPLLREKGLGGNKSPISHYSLH